MRRVGAHQLQITAPLARLATRQHGVAARRQLDRLGFTDQMIQTRVGRGDLIRVHRGVYALGHARLTAHARWMAAVLACGIHALLSHRDALALHDVWRIGSGEVHVTAPEWHRHAGVRCHTTRRPDRLAPLVVDGIPVTSLERAVLDEAATLSPQRLRDLLEEIERRDRFDLRRFSDMLQSSVGHPGVGRLNAALALVSAQPPDLRSGLERDFLALIRRAGLPEPSTNVLVAGELFDFHWPRHRVIVEVDSWRYHRSRRSFENDRRRANIAALAGEMLLRITGEQIAGTPADVVAEVRAALKAG